MAVDALVSLFLCISGCMSRKGNMRLVLSVSVSPSIHWEGDCGLVGRTLDLESQAISHPEDRWCRGIVVWNPTDKVPTFFVTSALFGSTAAVYAFNRLSKSLWHLQTCLLNIMGTVYYDDFPMLDFKATSGSARKCSEDLLKLLGWQFAEDGRKALRFDCVFTVLGINMDLSQSSVGKVTICTRPDRVQSLLDTVEGLCSRGRVERGEAASLHGQLNFAHGQYIGSELKPVMHLFASIASEGWSDAKRCELDSAASFMSRVLKHAKPELCPALVFSDGAWEPGAPKPEGAGLVLIDPLSRLNVVHQVAIPPLLIDSWTAGSKKQVITELELWPVVVGMQNLSSILRKRRVLWFIDNNAVKDMLVKGSTRGSNLFAMISESLFLAGLCEAKLWISRVPSKSNIADFPSRGDSVAAAKLIDGVVGPDLQPSLDFVEVMLQSNTYDGYMKAKGDRPIVDAGKLSDCCKISLVQLRHPSIVYFVGS